MIEIGPNIYEHDLLGLFWGYEPKDEEDGKVYALLSRVCRAWVIDRNRDKDHEMLCDISLSEEEQRIVMENKLMEHPNLEVRTRFLDVMLRFIKGNEHIERMRQASDGYLQLYKETGSVLYFVRAFEIRVVKSLYDDAFLEELRDVVIGSIIHPGWLTKVLNQVKINVSDGLDNPYVKTILGTYAMVNTEDAHWRDGYWDMLHGIGAIEDKEWHYQKALNWEGYADRMEANKKENVFNANHHAILQDGHNEIYKVKDDYPEDYRRIRDKYNAAKKDFVEALSLYGVRFKYQVPESVAKQIHKHMSELRLESVVQVVVTYLSLPFYPSWKRLVDKQVEQSKQQSDVIERFFPNSQTLDEEGNVSGISDYEQNHHLQVHRYIRATMMYHVLCLYERVGEHTLDYSEELFYEMLLGCKPSFVEEDKVQHWAKAYYYYFNGDIVIASHLLMPQFENALHNLLEGIVEDVTKLNEQVQKEPTLIKVLNELKPYCNSTLHDELTMFFVDGNDVNYRNRLMHGLMGSMDMLRYGHYMFYLANLLYFRGRKFLEMGEEKNTAMA